MPPPRFEPYGVFVTENRDVYVADHSGKVVVFDDSGAVVAVGGSHEHIVMVPHRHRRLLAVVSVRFNQIGTRGRPGQYLHPGFRCGTGAGL
mgnify:CR=1 FL=1